MAQILDPVPTGQRNVLLCCYVNATSQIQVARITNIENWYCERVVFPGQRLVFEALPQAQLEVHTGMMASAILSDTIPCERLSISDGNDNEIEEEFVSTTALTDKKQTIQTSDKQNSPASDLNAALV